MKKPDVLRDGAPWAMRAELDTRDDNKLRNVSIVYGDQQAGVIAREILESRKDARLLEKFDKLSAEVHVTRFSKWFQTTCLSLTVVLGIIAAGAGIISAFPETKVWIFYHSHLTNAIPQANPATPQIPNDSLIPRVIHNTHASSGSDSMKDSKNPQPLPIRKPVDTPRVVDTVYKQKKKASELQIDSPLIHKHDSTPPATPPNNPLPPAIWLRQTR
jgi:hypothetical protein